MDHHQNPPQGAVPPYEPNPSFAQPQMQHHDSYNNAPIQQYPPQQQQPYQSPMASPPVTEQKHEYYPTQAAMPQHQPSNPIPQQHPPQQSQYQIATPIQSLGEGAAPVDCPCCHMRALTKTEYHSGNTTNDCEAERFKTFRDISFGDSYDWLESLFAPELVAYVAWQQRQEATKICQEVRAIYGQPKPLSLFVKARRHLGARLLGSQVYKTHNHSPPPSPKVQRPVRSAWEEVHGFFVLMGGFAFTIDSSQTKFLPDNTIRTTLTPDGLRFLLHHEPDALPDITAEQIKDKSKADGLKKTVVCIQALWFCAQCINRLAQSLPVCLLELNTFGHALCTLAIYIFWWEKPLDIEEPTIISDEKLHPIFAYMWMSSRVSAKPYSSHDMPHGLQDEFHCIWPFEHPDLTDLSFNSADLLAQTQSSTSTPHVSFNNRASPPETTPNSHSDPPEPQLRKERPSYLAPTFRLKRYIRHLFNSASPSTFTPGLSTRKTAIHALSPSSLSRRSLALTAINTYGLQSDLSSRHQTATSGRFFIPYLNLRIPFLDTLHNNNLNPRLELRAPNALFSVAAGGIIPGFAVSGALYGSLHLAAWRAPFPSEAEKILWRTSSISVTCTGIVFGLMALTIKTKLVKESFTRASYILGWGKNVAPKATNSSKSRRWLSTASSFFYDRVNFIDEDDRNKARWKSSNKNIEIRAGADAAGSAMLPRTLSLRAFRWQLASLFLPLIVAFQMRAWSMMEGLDVISVNLTQWSIVLLVCHDPRSRFKRLRPQPKTLVAQEHTTRSRGGEQALHKEEPYPDEMSRRISWVMTLLVSLRLSNWKIGEASHDRKQPVKPMTRLAFFKYGLFLATQSFIILDLTSTWARQDPYFHKSGIDIDDDLQDVVGKPAIYSFLSQHLPPRIPRTAVLAGQAYACITQGGSLSVLPVVALNAVGLWPDEWSPHTWPIFFGRFSAVSEKGLRGLWGTWWHQTNRYLSIPGRALAQAVGISTRSTLGFMLQVVSAFFLSGIMHMGLIPPRPRGTSMMAMEMRFYIASFFWLQILGIGMELCAANLARRISLGRIISSIGTCPNDKGLADSTYSVDFTTIEGIPSEWTLADATNVTLGSQGAEFTFAKRYDAPTMWTNFKFFFGRVEFVVQAAKGTGVVSSMVLLSGDLDEIDWEFLGSATSTVQTNYFGKGYTGSYNRSTTPAVANPQSTFHTYTLDWSPTALVWSIDGTAVRTLNAADADGNGSQYPQSPMKVSLSLWDAGDPDAATQTWGGGVTPIPPPEPYTMYVKSVKIWNTNPAEQYQYTDQSGSYKSIKIINDKMAASSSSTDLTQSTETLSLGSTSVATSSSSTSMASSTSSASGTVVQSGTQTVVPLPGTSSDAVSTTSDKITQDASSATSSPVLSRSDTGIWSWDSPSSTAAASSLQGSNVMKMQTVYSTVMVTITSCHPDVKICPATTTSRVMSTLVPMSLPTSWAIPLPTVIPKVSVKSSMSVSLSLHIPVPLTSKTSTGGMSISAKLPVPVGSSSAASCSCAPAVTSYITVTASSHTPSVYPATPVILPSSSHVTSAIGSSHPPVSPKFTGSSKRASTGAAQSWVTMVTTAGGSTMTTMVMSMSGSSAAVTQIGFGGVSSMVAVSSAATSSGRPSASSSSNSGIPVSGHGVKSTLASAATTVSKMIPSPHFGTEVHSLASASSSSPSTSSSSRATSSSTPTPSGTAIATPVSSLPDTAAYWSSMSAAYGSPSLPATSTNTGKWSPQAQTLAVVQATSSSLKSSTSSMSAEAHKDGYVTDSGARSSLSSASSWLSAFPTFFSTFTLLPPPPSSTSLSPPPSSLSSSSMSADTTHPTFFSTFTLLPPPPSSTSLSLSPSSLPSSLSSSAQTPTTATSSSAGDTTWTTPSGDAGASATAGATYTAMAVNGSMSGNGSLAFKGEGSLVRVGMMGWGVWEVAAIAGVVAMGL
ncbi:MAG: hypothetical protein L6R41_005725 [Letrouitia leprolyta]|nr:MAG: hypothetical protein L6R41_005725 [Letrouitia leprolyta]